MNSDIRAPQHHDASGCGSASSAPDIENSPPATPDTLTDRELVRRFQSGDKAAFDQIVLRHRPRMLRVACNVVQSRGDAEEVAQDTFVRAYRALGEFRGDASLATWLHRITYNLACHRYWYLRRRRWHATQSLTDPISPERPDTVGDLIPSNAPTPVAEASLEDLTQALGRSMGKLDAPQREILERRCVLEQTYEDIAGALGLDVGTVKSRVSRARAALRRTLEHDAPEYPAAGRAAGWFEPARETAGHRVLCA